MPRSPDGANDNPILLGKYVERDGERAFKCDTGGAHARLAERKCVTPQGGIECGGRRYAVALVGIVDPQPGQLVVGRRAPLDGKAHAVRPKLFQISLSGRPSGSWSR